MKDLSFYVHIPFCDHKCIYCDFYSIITHENTSAYFNSLFREIDHFAEKLAKDFIVKTIFFGGGTPSFVNPDLIRKTIEKLREKFIFYDYVETTLETNPGTVTNEKIREFKDAGINRVSVGIQSFDDDELKFLTRIHDKKTAIETVVNVYNAGIENISIDLIFNLPGQSKERWANNLDQAIKLPVKHISAYSLILEKGTILNKLVLDGKVNMQDEDYDADLYEHTMDFLTGKGFNQYEVSNFCKPGFECLHNMAYWQHKEYLGLGPSAHSFIGDERWWNFSSLKMYIDSVNSKGNAIRNSEKLTDGEMLEEYIMLNLRGSGLDLNLLEQKFGNEWYESNKKFLDRILHDGLITSKDNFIKFTPGGYALCDEILTGFH